ncbi:MAG: hypothetical protein ACYC6C_11160 [Coriobacteriia bacterium]
MLDIDVMRVLVAMLFSTNINTNMDTTKDAQNVGRASPLKEPAHPVTTILALTVFMVVVRLVLK